MLAKIFNKTWFFFEYTHVCLISWKLMLNIFEIEVGMSFFQAKVRLSERKVGEECLGGHSSDGCLQTQSQTQTKENVQGETQVWPW